MSAVFDTPAAAAAAPAPRPEMRMMRRDLIVPSLTNPRKTFNPKKMEELTESARANGIMQPIIIRPLPASRLGETFNNRARNAPLPTHEIVFGERRWRASGPAKLDEIPTIIRHLTDEQVLEFQIVENLQREDVSELEEAEGYQFLMDKAGMTADQVAEKIGKSRAYVYSRTKVLDLCQAGRIALRDGKLDFSKGLLVARIPSEAQQLKAIKDITGERGYHGEPMGHRAAAEHIRDNFMLALSKARFTITDATLLKEAGACNVCTKRTGANPELFSDVKSADVCTDAPCFHKKEEAHAAVLMEAAKAKGQNVIGGKEAAELVVSGSYGPTPKLKGYRRLDDAEDSPTDQPLRKLIGKLMKAEGIEPTMIDNPRKTGDLIACLPNDVALRLVKAVEAAAKEEGAKAVSKEVQKLVDDKKAKAEARAKAQYEQAWRNQLLAHAWAEIETKDSECFSLDVHRYLVKREASSLSAEDAEAIAEILGLGKVGAHSAVIDHAKTTDRPDVLHLLLIMQRSSAANEYGYGRPANEGLMLVAGAALNDRLPVVINDAQADAKAKYLSAPVKSEAPKSASTPKPAAQASSSRAQGKGKKGPATQAPATAPKTSTEEARAQIAAELARMEETDQAPAAQGNEGQAVAIAQPGTAPSGSDGAAAEALDQAPPAQGDEAPPAAPAPAAAPVLEVGGYAMVSKKHLNKRFRGHLVKLSQRIRSADGWSWLVHRVDGKEGPFGPSENDLTPAPAPVATDSASAQAPDQAPAAQGDEAPPAAPAPATPSPSTKASAHAMKGAASTEASAPDGGVWPFPTPAETAAAPAATIEIAPGLRVRVSADVYAAEKQAYAGKEGTVAGSLKGFKGTWRVDFDQADVGDAKPTNTFKAKELEVIA